MIPKIIHYCWFGGNPKPRLFFKCFKSWKKYCKDYEIIEWNEDNFDISSCPLYVQQAYHEKKWAFVTDYVRLKVVYDHGGIYLDTDVELKKKINHLLSYDSFFGFEDGIHIATGLGFGAVANAYILKELMDDYKSITFIKEDGSYDSLPCPVRNTEVFLKHGLTQNDEMQMLMDNILILPSIYLCPISYNTGEFKKSRKTLSIHWFSASWHSEEQRKKHEETKRKFRKEQRIDSIVHMPNRILLKLLGGKKYEKLKKFF